MKYLVTKDVNMTYDGEKIFIPKGTILYEIPNDHLGNIKYSKLFNWNGESLLLDVDVDFLKSIN